MDELGSRQEFAPILGGFVIETLRLRENQYAQPSVPQDIEAIAQVGLRRLYAKYHEYGADKQTLKTELTRLDASASKLSEQLPVFGIIEEARAIAYNDYPDAEAVFIDLRRAFALALEQTPDTSIEQPPAA